MKAAVYNKKTEKLEIKNINKPELKGKGAIIKVHGSGLCGSDIVKIKQSHLSNGAVAGHEIVGEIVEINSDNIEIKQGDRVAAGHHVPCFVCRYCRDESYSMCRDFKLSNIYPGGFCEYIYISQAHLENTVFKLESDITDIEASYTEPAACCLRAVKRANLNLGDNVLIIGLGSIGLIMGQIAKSFGAFATGFDILDERLEFAKNSGFDSANKYTTLEESSAAYKKITDGIGADKIFLTSGSSSSIELALSCVRDGGTVIVFSSVSDEMAGYLNNDIYYRELKVMGSYSPSPVDLCEALKLIEKKVIKLDNFTSVYNIENINQAIEDTIANKILKAYIKI